VAVGSGGAEQAIRTKIKIDASATFFMILLRCNPFEVADQYTIG
jgi:hypothetical protein